MSLLLYNKYTNNFYNNIKISNFLNIIISKMYNNINLYNNVIIYCTLIMIIMK